MKKILLVSSVALVIVLAGCSLFNKKEDVPQATVDETVLERKIGVVNSSAESGVLAPPSEFVLMTDSGEKIYINSLSVNLKRYNKRKIEAEGKWNDERTLFIVEDVTSLGNETATKTDYINSKMGIKFSYPAIWFLKESANVNGLQKIVITPYEADDTETGNVDKIEIERTENNKKETPREFLGLDEQFRLSNPSDASAASFQESKIGLSGLSAVKKTTGSGDKVEFFVARDSYMFSFSHTTVGDKDKDIYRNAFYDIVMGFDFIPFDESGTSTAVSMKDKSLTELGETELAKRKEIEDLSKVEAVKVEAEKTVAQTKQLFVDYIKKEISSLAAEPASLGGTWYVLKLEFAYPEGKPEEFNAVYVTYEDGHSLAKILLNVPDRSDASKMTRVAYFKPGDATDWVLSEGIDSAKGLEKSLINVTSGDLKETVVKKGMTLLDAKSFKIKIQYPSKFYWESKNGEYHFGDKPDIFSNIFFVLRKNPSVLPDKMTKIDDINGKSATSGHGDEGLNVICIDGNAKYCLSGATDSEATMIEMLGTIEE